MVPKYNIYSQCTNSIFVNQLFNSFDEVQAVANKCNEEILYHEIGGLYFDENFVNNVEKVKLNHEEIFNEYKKIEEKIEQETYDMKVTKTRDYNLEDIIEKIIEKPSEFYTKLAYALSVEEREYLKKLIRNRSCNNCINGSCRVEYYEKVGLDDTGKLQGNSCLGWTNPELVGRQLILKKSKG